MRGGGDRGWGGLEERRGGKRGEGKGEGEERGGERGESGKERTGGGGGGGSKEGVAPQFVSQSLTEFPPSGSANPVLFPPPPSFLFSTPLSIRERAQSAGVSKRGTWEWGGGGGQSYLWMEGKEAVMGREME